MRLREYLFNLRLRLYRLIPIKKNRIVFISHLGKTYACNPRYLCEYIAKEFPGKYELIWVYDKQVGRIPTLPEGVDSVPFFSHKCLKLIATAGTIVSNTRISDAFYFEKRKGQFYLQTWHSSMRLKCIEADANLGIKYENFAKKDSSKIDAIISGSRLSTHIFKNSFWYNGEIIESGTPRIDWLRNISREQIDRIYTKAGLSKEYKYLLYAPTFRKGCVLDAYLREFDNLCSALGLRFGGKWKILYRLHPNLKGIVNVDDMSKCVSDMTDYDDIQELLAVSEVLVTDYSSSMFDALLCDKKCMLYASDLKNYIANERGLYFDVASLPFPIAQDEKKLQDLVTSFDEEKYQQTTQSFLQDIGSKESGEACKTIAKYIIEHL